VLFPSLLKRQMTASLLLTHDKLFLTLDFKRRRTKFLKKERKFYARVFTGEISIEETLKEIRNWLEVTTEDFILEKLEDYPGKYRPTIRITPRILLDFNVTSEEVTALL
jgi:hypothetical protein